MPEIQVENSPEILPKNEISTHKETFLEPIDNREVSDETRKHYIKIYNMHSLCHLSYLQISEELGIHWNTVYNACKWIRDNSFILSTEEYFKDAENLIGAELRKYDEMIEEARKGEIVIVNGNVLMADGKEVRRVSKGYIRMLMSDKREYVKLLFDIRGLSQRSQFILAKSETKINTTMNFSIGESANDMEEHDRQALIKICRKYGKSPS